VHFHHFIKNLRICKSNYIFYNIYHPIQPIRLTIFQPFSKKLCFENIFNIIYNVNAQFEKSWKCNDTMLEIDRLEEVEDEDSFINLLFKERKL
jgi:hypothetical protein